MKIQLTNTAAAFAALALLSGCVSFGPDVPDQLIALTAENSAPAGLLGTAAAGTRIVVLDPEAASRLDVARVPVQVNDAAVAYLEDATWVERPARQFRRLLAETLRANGNRLVLEGDDELDGTEVVLSGRLLDMGYHAPTQSVVVRYDAVRRGAGGAVQSRRFEAAVPGVAPTAQAVAPALNRAANDVAMQVAAWLN